MGFEEAIRVTAKIDWEAVAAISGALVFVANLLLAVSTWGMARAARIQAQAADDQAVAAKAQAAASSALAEIARRQLEISASAVLRISRREGTPSVVWMRLDSYGADPGWLVYVHNSGAAGACRIAEPQPPRRDGAAGRNRRR